MNEKDLNIPPEAMMGAVRILQEGGHQFNVVDSESDYSGYRLLILPDLITVSPKLKEKLLKFITDGGSIITSYRSGLDEKFTSFQMENMGVELAGDAPYSPDFIDANGPLAKGLPQTELVMYLKGLQVKATNGAQVLLKVNRPYFNREWDHFSSHKHTPSSGNEAYPAAVRFNRSIYFAHPVFSQYAKNAPLWVKKIVLNAIHQLLPEPLIRHTGPSSLIATVNEQKENVRVILHLLHYIPERRGVDFDTIEEILPLNNVVISYKQLKRVNTVQLVPQKKALPFKLINGRIEFTVPEIMGHQMVVIS